MRAWIVAHKALAAGGGFVVVALGAWLVFYFFGFQNAVIDERVDEPVPVEAPADVGAGTTGGGGTAQPADREPAVLAEGRFRSIEHETSGSAAILSLPSGRTILRIEDLDTLNGPDLKVYLSQSPAEADPSTFDDHYVSLGDLKGNQGDQNYDVPPSVNPNRFATAVVWCERFSVGFGVAPLAPV